VPNTGSSIKLFASVLPASRSVQVGTPATAFATIINAGPGDGTTCSISPAASVPANFDYQTTNPATNAVTGTANTPVNIAQGAAQSFVIALTPTAPFGPTDLGFNFACANAAAAPQVAGLNSLLISGSASPVPDLVALAASDDPGFVDIPGNTGTGVFSVATVNLGTAASITVSGDTGAASLPVSITICQTDPKSGACLQPPSATVTTSVAANATPTFGFFVAGSGPVADSPGANRVFARFKDSGGAVRGSTSVAVRTK